MLTPTTFGLIVFVLAVAVVFGARWLLRESRRATLARDAALARLASEMATARDPQKPDRLAGTIAGRACAVWETGMAGGDGREYAVRYQVALASTLRLELYHQQGSFGARLVDDVEIGDPEFDKWFIVRTDDLERARLALTPELRRQLIEWLRNGWIVRLWTRDGHLWIDGGYGLIKAAYVDRAADVLRAAVQLADRLDSPVLGP